MDVSVIKTAHDALYAKVSLVQAGYQPTPSHCEEYSLLLHQMTDQVSSIHNKVRRQTPLVNAGYAIRVSLITSLLHDYINEMRNIFSNKGSEEYEKVVNVIILGGGLDVLGCWLVYVAQKANIYLRIYEVDGPENSAAKRQALHSMKSVSVKDGIVYLDSVKSKHSYSIISANLTNISHLRNELFEKEDFDKSFSTIALSELVLAYLDRHASLSILDFISNEIFTTCNCLLIAYEPLKRSNTHASTMTFSEVYNERFSAKLNKGKHSNTQVRTNTFCSIGNNESDVVVYLEKMYNHVQVLSSLTAASCCCSHLIPPELFDEHAALYLHLTCYAAILGFSRNTSNSFTKNVMQSWKSKNDSFTNNFVITCVEKSHQSSVRYLFGETYKELMSTNKSLRKMVKAALNTDLSDKFCQSTECRNNSSILSTYVGWGGNFWVAHTVSSGAEASSVIGVVGLRFVEESEHAIIRGKVGRCKIYELQRLAVDKNFRRMKVASKLLSRLESWIESEHIENDHTSEPILLVAVTLSILEDANDFYKRKGFILEQEALVKDLKYFTYVKRLK